jgi:heme exporter protein C
MEPIVEPLSPVLKFLPLVLLVIILIIIGFHIFKPTLRKTTWKVLGLIGVIMMLVQPFLALIWAPPEKYMGDVGRIMYMHVPQVWMALVALTINFVCSVAYLFKKSIVTDCLAEASAEVGVYFGGVGILLGAIWAKPTWGTWWTWDPRLTTAAILLVIYSGYLALRKFTDDPEKRATFSSVMGIVAFVDIPVLWFSVRWWKSMHQIQSSPATVDAAMTMVLRWSATGFLALMVAFMYHRFHVSYAARQGESTLPEMNPSPKGAQ